MKIFGLMGDVLKGIKYIDVVMHQGIFDSDENLKKIHKKYPNAQIMLFYGNDWKVIPMWRYSEYSYQSGSEHNDQLTRVELNK